MGEGREKGKRDEDRCSKKKRSRKKETNERTKKRVKSEAWAEKAGRNLRIVCGFTR